MAEPARRTSRVAEVRGFDMRSLWRLTVWGVSATVALLVAVFAAYSNVGTQRLMTAMASGYASGQQRPPAPPPAQIAARPSEADIETRRLADAVRTLTADRDRLLARLGVLERSVEDITGSIRRQNSSNQSSGNTNSSNTAGPPTQPAQRQAVVTPTVPPAETPVAPLAVTPVAVPEGAPSRALTPSATAKPAEEVVAKPELGIDVGGAVNFAGLRALWTSLRATNAAHLEGLQPAVAVRENARTRATELRLLLGPIADAEAAGRLCAPLTAARRYCQSVPFEGQHLSIADLYQERKATPASRPATPAPSPRPARPNP